MASVVVIEGRRDLDIALSLDLPVRGYPYEAEGELELPSPLAPQLADARADGAQPLFVADEINLEAIAAAEPDPIISRAEDVEPLMDQFEHIAPVVAIGEQDSSTWQDDLALVAKATGTEERAFGLITEYENEVSRIAEEYADVLAQKTFVPMSYNGEKAETRANRLLSLVLRDVGATPSNAFQKVIDGEGGEYSPEQLLSGFGDADGIVELVNDAETRATLTADPLYQQLPAVQNGHVVRSDKQTHEGAALTAMNALHVIERLLQTF